MSKQRRYQTTNSRVHLLAHRFLDFLAQDHPSAAQRTFQELLKMLKSRDRVLSVLIDVAGFKFLWARRKEPMIAGLLHPKKNTRVGRPRGRTSRDALSYALATLVDQMGISPAELLRALGRDASSGSADFNWLRTRLRRGRDLRNGAASVDPSLVVPIFLCGYHKSQHALVHSLVPYVLPGARHSMDEKKLSSVLAGLCRSVPEDSL